MLIYLTSNSGYPQSEAQRASSPPDMKYTATRNLTFTAATLALFAGGAVAQSGHNLNGVGAVNQGMAGVSTALPIDPSGALHWNPGAITGLHSGVLQFSMEMFKPTLTIDSTVPDGSGGFIHGATDSDLGVSAIPSFAFVHEIEGTEWTFGLGAFGVAGFGVDFAADGTNPIFMPAPNGFGQVSSEFQMLQLTPTFTRQLDKNWSVGFAPTINQARLRVAPGSFASPDDANGDGTPSYPSAGSGDDSWGFGGQIGAFYKGDDGWNFGASYKSTQNFQAFKFNAVDEVGMPRILEFDMDFPAIASLGVGYTGFDRWQLGADLRYIDYANTNGFEKSGFDATGAVQGFDWDSIMILAIAAQYEVSSNWTVRGGLSFNGSPIDASSIGYNIPAPAIIENHLGLGLTYNFNDHMLLDLGYTHGFESSVNGPIQSPAGPAPGSDVNATMSTDSVLIGVRMNF